MKPNKAENAHIYEIRRENLSKIKDKDFGGSRKALAEALNKSPSTIDSYLSPSTERTISDSVARQYERALGLEMGALDVLTENNTHIYYVIISVPNRYIYHVLDRLHDFEPVKEATATLAGIDVLAKIEVDEPGLLEIIIKKIGRFPGVTRTDTHTCVNTLHWQRSQKESYRLQKPEIEVENLPQREREIRINNHFKAIKQLEKGILISRDTKINAIAPEEIFDDVKKEVCIIVYLKNLIENGDEFLFSPLSQKQLSMHLIILLEKDEFKSSNLQKIREIWEKFKSIEYNIKFLSEYRWKPSKFHTAPEEMIIVDGEYVYLMQKLQKEIRDTEDDVNNYIETFNANWKTAFSFEKLESQLK